MKQGGDIGKFGKTSKNAEYNLKVIKGLANAASALPNEEARQQKMVDFMDKTQKDMMNWHGLHKDVWKPKKKQKRQKRIKPMIQEFMNGATFCI